MNNQELLEFKDSDGINIKEIALKYLRFWPLYLTGILIALAIAKIQLRYSQNIYNTYATIKILDESKGGAIDLSGLPVNGSFLNQGINLDNEIEILHSKKLLMKVVTALDLETSYFSKGQVRTSELWGSNKPFNVTWIMNDSASLSSSPNFNIVFNTPNTYTLSLESGYSKEKIKIGDWVEYKNFTFKIDKIEGSDYKQKAENKTPFSFAYKSTLSRAASLSKMLNIVQLGAGSEILMLSINGPIKEKNEAILNEVIKQFDLDGQNDRKQVAESTEDFVNGRIKLLVSELDSIETSLVSYKKSNNMVSVEIDASKYTGRDEDAFNNEVDVSTQLLLAKGLKSRIENSDGMDYIPADIGLSDSRLNELIRAHNALISERNRTLQSTTELHPSVQALNNQLIQGKYNLILSMTNYIESTEEKLASIRNIQNKTSGQLSAIPYKEKVLRNISRQQSIKENLYLFLLEKRESAALTSAVTSPSIKVVDFAFTNGKPVSPDRRTKYLISFFIGLILPLAFVYLKYLLDTKIHTKEDVVRELNNPNLPLIGEIPQIQKSDNEVIGINDRSELAEAFRVVRTNLSYMDSSREKGECRIYMVTSSTKSEGKTFTSLNTSISLATSNYKVLLVGADLRNPQLHQYLGLDKNTAGLTTYLYDENADVDELIQNKAFNFENLDVILSGYIPPNPAELLLNGRFEKFLNQMKSQYDYIIVDSAPTLLVTDSLLISKFVDLSIYMIRAGITDVKILEHISLIQRSGKLPKIGLVLNGVGRNGSYGYGYKYNYGYGYTYSEDVSNKKWWEIWK